MKLLVEVRNYSRPRIQLTVGQHQTKVKVPAQLDGTFRDRVSAFAIQATKACEVIPSRKTMRGVIGLDEKTGKMIVTLAQDSPNNGITTTVVEP